MQQREVATGGERTHRDHQCDDRRSTAQASVHRRLLSTRSGVRSRPCSVRRTASKTSAPDPDDGAAQQFRTAIFAGMSSGTLIRQARKRANLTQAELATKVGTTQSAIARWERGASHPSLERLQGLVDACGLELRLGLEPRNDDEIAVLRRNLALTVDERVTRIVRLHRFVDAGRAALATSRTEH